MAVYEITASTTTSAAPEDVWAVLDDFRGWPTWMPGLQNVRIELLSPGPPRLGYRFRVRGKLVHADLDVTGFGPLERTTAFQVSFPPITGRNSCVLVPLDNGQHRLERVDSFDLPKQFVRFLDKTQRNRFERLACEFLVALKQSAERRAPYGVRRVG